MGENFEMPSQYTVVDFLGQGAYGCVCAVRDQSSNSMWAVKKCKSIFQSRTLAKRTLREARLLRLLVHPNIVSLRRVLTPRFEKTFSSLYLVFDLMETDLASIIRSSQPLSDRHVQYFTLQLLKACQHMHQNMVCHRDLKPRNILVNGDCTLKVADFGLGRVHSSANRKTVAMTDYVSTRWYRAPEILCGDGRGYDFGIDLWAVGCVIGELIGRVPLFPGADVMKQIDLIVGALGKPPAVFTEQLRKPTAKQIFESLPPEHPTRREVGDMIHYATRTYRNDIKVTPGPDGVSPHALELIDRLLQYDSKVRPTAEDCLSSPYFAGEQEQPGVSESPTDFAKENVSGEEVRGGGSDVDKPPDSHEVLSPPTVCHISQDDISREFYFESSRLTFDMLRKELLREAAAYSENNPAVTPEERGSVDTKAEAPGQACLGFVDIDESKSPSTQANCIHASGAAMNADFKQQHETSNTGSMRFSICGPAPSPVLTQLVESKAADIKMVEKSQAEDSQGEAWCSIQ